MNSVLGNMMPYMLKVGGEELGSDIKGGESFAKTGLCSPGRDRMDVEG